MKKTYYFTGSEYFERVFGGSDPVCVDESERDRLIRGWEQPGESELTREALLEQWHEATADEIEQYGVYDS